MKKLLLSTVFAGCTFLSASVASSVPALAGSNCNDALTTHCDTVTDQTYGGGGSNPDLVPIVACLPDDLYESIRLQDGSSAFEVGFYYGNGEPEVVKTVTNDDCWTRSKAGKVQYGHPGSWVVAFICCTKYCGWVGGIITQDGQVTLKPFAMPRGHDPMRQFRTANGKYDKSQILN